MRKVCIVILTIALLSTVSPAFALIQAWRLGSVGQDSVANTKCLSVSIATTAHYMTFESPMGTDYQVTAGHTLYITKVFVQGTAAGYGPSFGYGDNGVADGVAAPTNWVQLTRIFAIQDSAKTWDWDVIIAIPAGKYPCALSLGVFSCTVFGVEVEN